MDYYSPHSSLFADDAGSSPAGDRKKLCPVTPSQTPSHSASKRRKLSYDSEEFRGWPTTYQRCAEMLRPGSRLNPLIVDDEESPAPVQSAESYPVILRRYEAPLWDNDHESCADWEEEMMDMYGEDIRDWPADVREEHDERNMYLWDSFCEQ